MPEGQWNRATPRPRAAAGGSDSNSAGAAAAGASAAWLTLGIAELGAGLAEPLPSPVVVVAETVVATAPSGVTDWAIDVLGTASTAVLQLGVVVIVGLLGAMLGRLAAARRAEAAGGVLALALVVPLAGQARDGALWPGLASAVLVATVGLAALRLLVPRGLGNPPVPSDGGVPRRRVLRAGAAAIALGALAGGTGRWLASARRLGQARADAAVPAPPDALPAAPSAASLDIEGITPLFTPNDEFYVIDTAVRSPRVDPAQWRLRVSGLVDRPLTLSYDELLEAATDEADVLLTCVSNEVGGGLAGLARWQGVRLDALLERAGISSEAEQVMGRSVDGFSAGFPVEVLDGRDAIVAVAMNGQTLPTIHGFPARLVVPGLYGYVSATKWLEEIELTTWDADGYWVPRGWAKEGPIKTASRIDRPRRPAQVEPGLVTLAGVAWAPMAGVAEVEVRVGDGPWQAARLAESIGGANWRQWALDWEAVPGEHEVVVRAIDGDGEVQTAEESGPRPDGATGYDRLTVYVDAGSS